MVSRDIEERKLRKLWNKYGTKKEFVLFAKIARKHNISSWMINEYLKNAPARRLTSSDKFVS